MSDAAKTLTLVGGILNLIGAIAFIAIFAMIFGWMLFIPELVMIAFIMGAIFIIPAIIGLLFGLLPLMWRDEPGRHRVGLIILGILSLASIGGILLLIAGIIAEEESA
ncbi:MAG: hypothetical protein Q6361_01615 [Candidatus Hermodarchaeota archaeon]|jgi:hypothetical protein|nr:hypothetical protein [Candidatus Hermodarchaeota archaeon]